MRKREDNKPHFRSAAKRAAFDHIERLRRDAERKLRSNKYDIEKLAREQGQLKNDIAALHQLRQEFLK